jgi:hypothetical protein
MTGARGEEPTNRREDGWPTKMGAAYAGPRRVSFFAELTHNLCTTRATRNYPTTHRKNHRRRFVSGEPASAHCCHHARATSE